MEVPQLILPLRRINFEGVHWFTGSNLITHHQAIFDYVWGELLLISFIIFDGGIAAEFDESGNQVLNDHDNILGRVVLGLILMHCYGHTNSDVVSRV